MEDCPASWPSEQLFASPVFVARKLCQRLHQSVGLCLEDLQAVRQIPPHNQRDLLLAKLLDRDLQRIRLTLDIHQHRRVHTARRVSPRFLPIRTLPKLPRGSWRPALPPGSSNIPNLQRPCPQHSRPLVLGHVRRSDPLIVRDLLLQHSLDRIQRACCLLLLCRVAARYNVVAVVVIAICLLLAVLVAANVQVLFKVLLFVDDVIVCVPATVLEGVRVEVRIRQHVLANTVVHGLIVAAAVVGHVVLRAAGKSGGRVAQSDRLGGSDSETWSNCPAGLRVLLSHVRGLCDLDQKFQDRN